MYSKDTQKHISFLTKVNFNIRCLALGYSKLNYLLESGAVGEQPLCCTNIEREGGRELDRGTTTVTHQIVNAYLCLYPKSIYIYILCPVITYLKNKL
jgi:hypothetical protein